MLKLLSGNLRTRSTLLWSLSRHWGFLLRHLTIRRAYNAALCVFEMWRKRDVLRSHPFYLRAEVSAVCNLRCPGCLISKDTYVQSRKETGGPRLMSLEAFKRATHDLVPYLLKVNLYEEGEPLLNREIYSIIRYLSDNNISSCVSSNFSLKFTDEQLRQLIDCGLEHLIVAIDGASPETYAKYRVGGDLDLVHRNLARLMELRRQSPKSKLRVELQFIEFDYNAHERGAMEKLARELGVWRFTVVQGSSCAGWEGMRFTGGASARRKLGCYQTWVSAVIDSTGRLATCDYGEDHGIGTLGDAADYRRLGLRNHPLVRGLRRSFGDPDTPLNAICEHCSLYRMRNEEPTRLAAPVRKAVSLPVAG